MTRGKKALPQSLFVLTYIRNVGKLGQFNFLTCKLTWRPLLPTLGNRRGVTVGARKCQSLVRPPGLSYMCNLLCQTRQLFASFRAAHGLQISFVKRQQPSAAVVNSVVKKDMKFSRVTLAAAAETRKRHNFPDVSRKKRQLFQDDSLCSIILIIVKGRNLYSSLQVQQQPAF